MKNEFYVRCTQLVCPLWPVFIHAFITQEARIQELEKNLEQQDEEMKAQEEERARAKAERNKEFEQLQRTMQQMMDFFSSSPAFESFTSQQTYAPYH